MPHDLHTEWSVLPRGDVAPHWSGLYVTLNRHGTIWLSRATFVRFGSPPACIIMHDRYNQRIGLRPAKPDEPNAYPIRLRGRHGGRVVRAYRLLTEFGIRPNDTIEFIRPKIDVDGDLIVDLNKIRISPKAHSQCRTEKSKSPPQKVYETNENAVSSTRNYF